MQNFINTFDDNKKIIKAIILGVVGSACIIAVLMSITAVILTTSALLPYEYLAYIMLFIEAISVFFGGYIASRINKSKGLILGLINGVIIFTAITLSGLFTSGESVTYITLLKLIAIMIFSILGGIKGVNVKEKIHIK